MSTRQTFSVKGQLVNILGFSGIGALSTAQLFSEKAAIDYMETNGCVCVPVKFYLQKQTARYGPWPIVYRPFI